MITYRTTAKITGSQLTLDLPPELQGVEVEVFIVPVQAKKRTKDKSWLLQFPTWSKKDIEAIEEVTKKFSQWQIEEF